jgi:diacylglycerol kinase family enzyme
MSGRTKSGLTRPTTRLLIVSPKAGSADEASQRQLLMAFPGIPTVELDRKRDFRELLTPRALVIAAGGDGTVGVVARALAGSDKRLAILPMGTFNNFARWLGIPEDLAEAIAVVRNGRTDRVTIGRINGEPFLEMGALGLFGQALAFGEAAKGAELPELRDAFRLLVGARNFRFRLSGDLEAEGRTLSMVVANTSSTGARLELGDKDPTVPELELLVRAGESRTHIVSRVLRAGLRLRRSRPLEPEMRFRFRRITVTTRPKVPIYADLKRVGRTPAEIEAWAGALRVIRPRDSAPKRPRS